jgi:hypothetical protein
MISIVSEWFISIKTIEKRQAIDDDDRTAVGRWGAARADSGRAR